jgi:hypothetical protein
MYFYGFSINMKDGGIILVEIVEESNFFLDT